MIVPGLEMRRNRDARGTAGSALAQRPHSFDNGPYATAALRKSLASVYAKRLGLRDQVQAVIYTYETGLASGG